jgi:hypothetical protein
MPRDLPRQHPGPHYSELRPDQLGPWGIPISHTDSFGWVPVGRVSGRWTLDQATYEWARGNDYDPHVTNWHAYPGWANIQAYINQPRPPGVGSEALDWQAVFRLQLATLRGQGAANDAAPLPVAAEQPPAQQPSPPVVAIPTDVAPLTFAAAPTTQPGANPSAWYAAKAAPVAPAASTSSRVVIVGLLVLAGVALLRRGRARGN